MQLASNFSGFFSKLSNLLFEIGEMLPTYDEILRLSPSHISEPFRRSLTHLYVDMLEFFSAVARIFTQKGGSAWPHATSESHNFKIET